MADQSAPTPASNAAAATKSTTTTKRATAATKRSTAGKKAAATRKSNATSAKAKSTARKAKPKVQTPVERVQDYAEKAVVIPVGAALIARDRVVSTVDDITARYGSVDAAQRQFEQLRKELSADVKKAEQRGTTARTKAEREVKKTRTKVERELRTRRTRAEKEFRGLRRDMEARTDLFGSTVDNVVASVNKTGSEVANTVVDRVATRV